MPNHPKPEHDPTDPIPDPEPASPSLDQPDAGVFHHQPGNNPIKPSNLPTSDQQKTSQKHP
jgi:hypothetical protein